MRTSPNPPPRRWSSFGILLLDRHIFSEFAISFLAVMAFFALLILVASIFDKFGDIMKNGTPINMALLYFLYSLPFLLVQAVPIASMLAVIFSIGQLARHNEILAFMTSGVHALRIAAPVIFGGILITTSTIALNETVIPEMEQEARRLELVYLEGKSESKTNTEQNVFARGKENRSYSMRAYHSGDKRMYFPQIIDKTPDMASVKRLIKADSADFVANQPEQHRSEWLLHNARIWTNDDSGTPREYKAYPNDVHVYLEENLPAVLAQKRKPEEMNFMELREHVRIEAERNQPVYTFLTDLILKLTFPAGTLLIMLIGYSYAVRTRGGAAMAAFGYGMVWAFAYYACSAFMRALGHSGAVSPYVAGLAPLALFLGIAIRYLQRSYRWYS